MVTLAISPNFEKKVLNLSSGIYAACFTTIVFDNDAGLVLLTAFGAKG